VPTFLDTPAIILKRIDWRESSMMVTMLTREGGKLGVVARGVRKPKSDIGPALEPLTESQVVLSLSERSSLAHLKSADVAEYFAGLKSSFVRITLAGALCELVDHALPEGEEARELYAHLRAILSGIDTSDEAHGVNWLWKGILELSADLGYALSFEECVACGNPDGPHPAFSIVQGGPVCDACFADGPVVWSRETSEMLSWLSLVDHVGLTERRIPKAVNREIRDLLESCFQYHIPNFERFRSLELLRGG
jgi:DNA repair protein RecO (recombination protein O)